VNTWYDDKTSHWSADNTYL